MRIEYKTNKLEKICTNISEAERLHGIKMAEKIHQRIDELGAADNVQMLIKYGIGRCHPLKGNRQDQYAMDLVHPFRLIFKVKEEEIQIAKIQEIKDYH